MLLQCRPLSSILRPRAARAPQSARRWRRRCRREGVGASAAGAASASAGTSASVALVSVEAGSVPASDCLFFLSFSLAAMARHRANYRRQ